MKKYIILITIILSVFSCKELDKTVDIAPTTRVSENIILNTVDDAEQLLLGGYANIRDAYYNLYIPLSDIPTDDLKTTGSTGNIRGDLASYTFTANNGDALSVWGGCYRTLNIINTVIDRLPNLSGDNAKRSTLLGECYALRALTHFDLLRAFASSLNYPSSGGSGLGIPYLTSAPSTALFPRRNTIDECYQKTIDDITQAMNLLPNQPIDNNNVLRMNRIATMLLRARVELTRSNYAEALNWATQVIAVAPTQVNTSNFASMWNTTESRGEIMFKIRCLPNQTTIGREFWDEGTDRRFAAATNDLTSTYIVESPPTINPRVDVRFGSYFLQRPGNLVISKYRGGSSTQGLADIKIFRTSEAHLIRLECLARTGGSLTTIQTEYNNFRNNRITNNQPDTDFSSISINAVIGRIMAERRRELAVEGHRLYDLRRLGLGINRVDCAGSSPATCIIPANDFRMLAFPIPNAEIIANRNMVQNVGY